MDQKYVIVAAVVDTVRLTLFQQNGSTIVIQQGDHRLRPILDFVTPLLLEKGVALVPAELINQGAKSSTYRDFEKKTGTFIRFFRLAKDKLKSILDSSENVDPTVVGEVPVINKAIETIMEHAVPSDSPDFLSSNEEDTIVGVCENEVLADVQQIEAQLQRANEGEAEGMQNFLRRAAAVSKERRHSVEDLLRFMKRADTPVTASGDILIYKVLRRAHGELASQGDYVDCHTRRVPQKVGDKVMMDISLVDHNRSQECSNGLHVARRGYIGGFGGDVCIVGLVAPEDVIAVPNYDANKMRVCAYRIIEELSDEMYQALCQDRPITTIRGGAELLGRLLAGDHTEVLRTVEITQQQGHGIKITELENQQVTKMVHGKVTAAPAEAIEPVGEIGKTTRAAAVNPKDLVKKVKQAKTNSRQAEAQKLQKKIDAAKTPEARAKAINALRQFKRKAKVSWDKLGVSEPTE